MTVMIRMPLAASGPSLSGWSAMTHFSHNLRSNAGWIIVRGVVAVLLGIWSFVWPGVTLGALVIMWGAFALVDGVTALMAAWRMRDGSGPFWALLLAGLAGVCAAAVTLVMPGLTALVLALLIGAWAIAVGIFQIVAAIRLRKVIEGEFWLGLSGVVSLLFGGYVFMVPGAGALALIWTIGTFAILFGVLLIGLGFRLRSIAA